MSETLDPWLETQLRQLTRRNGVITTLSNGRPNRIVSVSDNGVNISTESSDAKGAGPQLVPAWMLNVAWKHLRATGSLTNRYLLASDGLNVKRSSAVCALLARPARRRRRLQPPDRASLPGIAATQGDSGHKLLRVFMGVVIP